MNTSAAPAIKDGQEAVIQRWLMSAQKLRRRPPATISRSPNRTTRALDIRSFRLLNMFFDSLDALAHVLPSMDRFGKNVHSLIMNGGGTDAKPTPVVRVARPGRQLIVG